MPEGAAFSAVYKETKDQLPACKLRVSQKRAADKIWEDYGTGKLKTMLKKNLLEGLGSEEASTYHVMININIMKEEYEYACDILAGKVQTDSPEESQRIKKCRIPPVFLENKVQLNLRSYQLELAFPAENGKNTIICAPTNSGKTYVAIGITKTHLAKIRNGKADGNGACVSSRPKPVLFIVNKVNLVLQQRQRFDYYLSDSYDVTDISGANAQDKTLDEVSQENDVIVLTAQILVDALKSKRVKITDFSLLIFDECHHTNKEHPYNEIMLTYLGIKFLPQTSPSQATGNVILPQIIGLTASLGVGKARNSKDAQDHILQLCANLDCSVIATVKKHIKVLEETTGNCKREWLEVLDGKKDYFDNIIEAVMIKIEGMIEQGPGRSSPPTICRSSQQYQQWLKAKERLTVRNRDQFTLVQHLLVYHTALAIKKSCRVKDALNYVHAFFKKHSEDKLTDIDHTLRQLYFKAQNDFNEEQKKHGEIKNPKLEAVANSLREKYHACVKEGGQKTAKGILFTKTRENTKALKAWLDENPDLSFIKAERLVGTGKGEDGMTQCQQEEIIANFRIGSVNLLVATTVGEEGIDIPDCKYVIKYDVCGNEIASIQSRGRVRDKAGKYEVVAGKETGVIEKENLNVIREVMMRDAIEQVKKMDENLYNDKVLDLQTRAVFQRQSKQSCKRHKKDKQPEKKVKLFCKKCSVFACSGDNIRCIKEAHHVIIDGHFSSKFSFKRSKCSREFNGVELTGPIFCQKCDAEWGVMLKYQSQEKPCIKASSFAFEFEDEVGIKTTQCVKKWKDVTFHVKDFDDCEDQVQECWMDIAELSLD